MGIAALGLDIGGTKTAAALVRADGTVLASRSAPTPAAEGPDAVLSLAAELARAVRAEAGAHAVAVVGAGVGTAGTVDHRAGVVRFATDLLPGWTGTPVGEWLSSALGLPVVVDNDVNAMALGEARELVGTVLVVAVGTGVGGAIVRDGCLEHGATGTAGEVAHLLVAPTSDGRRCGCGRVDHLEAIASGPNIALTYRRRTGRTGDLRAVAERADAGDPTADEVIVEGATVLGRALAGLADVLDPAAIVIGGGVPTVGRRWWDPLEAALRAEALPGPAGVDLRPTHLGPHAGVVGAALLALADRLER